MLRTLWIDGQNVGMVHVSEEEDPELRMDQNFKLALLALPRALEGFRPDRPVPPLERFALTVTALCRTIFGNEDTNVIFKVCDDHVREEGSMAYLWHQVRRTGDSECSCGKSYSRHPLEDRLGGAIHTLCNGDLVKL